MATLLKRPSYAKINLGLRVVRKRPDGFHDIETVFHRIGLQDLIEIGEADDISVVSTDPAAPSDHTNLAFRAAALLREATGLRKGVSIRIEKNIPVGAGLGGGSSDAATVLAMLSELWEIRLPPERLDELALRLGSDVPYFLRTGSAEAHGRGERLSYFQLDMPFAILVCTPGLHVSTAWAYGSVRPGNIQPDRPMRDRLVEALRDPALLPEALANDFEQPVFASFPPVAELKRNLLVSGAVAAAMSGSGSSVFGLFHTVEAAERASRTLRLPGVTVHVTPPHFSP